ncbi:MAG: response regulator transcription factor [Nannocystaceae bacterium]
MKILVVEDNSKLARFLSRALSEEGHVADVVHDGATALEQAVTLPYDLMILDWMLPDLDGLSVCRELRARGLRLPILMLTARADVSERIAGLNAGADDYLAKPFDLGELLARLRALHRRGAAAPQVQAIGALSIDRGARTIRAHGRTLALTAREYNLLIHLADAVGRPVPRTELLSKLWGIHFDPGSNVVEVHVKNLRDKLGADAPLIETVRGVGYRLAPAPPRPEPTGEGEGED